MIQSGQTVILGMMMEPYAVPQALVKRKDELENVSVLQPIATTDIDWFKPGYEKAFSVTTAFSGPHARQAVKERRVQYLISGGRMATSLPVRLPPDWCQFDWYNIPVSPPDEHGYCSLGPMIWMNKTYMRAARKVIAEVNDRLIRCYGIGHVHISELDYLVEASYPATYWQVSRLVSEFNTRCIEAIGSLVSTLVNDGDTIQIGTGTMTSTLTPYLEDKHDLGVHTELTPPGIVDLHRKGVITGRRKTLHPGKVISTAFILDYEDEPYVYMNPE